MRVRTPEVDCQRAVSSVAPATLTPPRTVCTRGSELGNSLCHSSLHPERNARPARRRLFALPRSLPCAGLAECRGNAHRPYLFTVKLAALLVPANVITVTFTVPNLAVIGTLHLI